MNFWTRFIEWCRRPNMIKLQGHNPSSEGVMSNVTTFASREFSDIVRSRRFTILNIIFGFVLITSMVGIYVQGINTSGFMPYWLVSHLTYISPVIGVALGCDVISSEREKGTLKIASVNGKILAATFAVFLALLIFSLTTLGASAIVLGLTPTVGESLRIAVFLPFTVLFAMTYYGIAAFISTIMKKTSQSVILSVTALAVLSFIIPILANFIAIAIAPPISMQEDSVESIARDVQRSAVHETVMSITPEYHLNRIGHYLFRWYWTTNEMGQHVLEEVSIMSRLMNAGPHILVLGMATALVFIASYVVFNRQDRSIDTWRSVPHKRNGIVYRRKNRRYPA